MQEGCNASNCRFGLCNSSAAPYLALEIHNINHFESFIHGGAWRDPTKLADIFDKSEKYILEHPAADHIAAFASINYRLSPHATHPVQPDDPEDPARNAKHPDHINDILDGIEFLQHKYGFGDRYILAGHSAGATLALQVCMSRTWSQTADFEVDPPAKKVIPPIAVLGLEGIYDIPALIEYHKTRPYYDIYDAFTHSAFGEGIQKDGDKEIDVWSAASPTSGKYAQTWPNGRLIVLAHSHEDELVEWEQVELVRTALVQEGWGQDGKELVMCELRGKHDEVWSDGREVARAVEETVQKLVVVLKED